MKNLWPQTGCNRIFVPYIGAYNVRTLSSDDKLLDLEAELSWINWTIIGLSEVWLKNKQTTLAIPCTTQVAMNANMELTLWSTNP